MSWRRWGGEQLLQTTPLYTPITSVPTGHSFNCCAAFWRLATQQLFNRPKVVREIRRHRRRDPTRFVNPTEKYANCKQYVAHRLSNFFEKAFVNRVRRRMDMRIVRFCHSTINVQIPLGSGSLVSGTNSTDSTVAGKHFCSPSRGAPYTLMSLA